MRIMCKMTLNYLTPMAQRFLGENNMFEKIFVLKEKLRKVYKSKGKVEGDS